MSRPTTILIGRLRHQAEGLKKVADELHNFGVYGCRHDSPFDPASKPDKPSSRVPGVPEAFSKLRELDDSLRGLVEALKNLTEVYEIWLDVQEGTESRIGGKDAG